MTYEIKKEGEKYNIYYTGGLYNGLKEFHSLDGNLTGEERGGYKKLNAPNWHSLEQQLRYANDSTLFGKAFTTASDKGLNLFMTTLVNGKLGHSSEAALAFAFSVLGVDWTDSEKATINTLLTQNNFTIQI
jgi:hypothetical protein